MPQYHPPTVVFQSFTPKSLEPFNGRDSERILLAINGIVFDVTAGRSFYGPGACILAGSETSTDVDAPRRNVRQFCWTGRFSWHGEAVIRCWYVFTELLFLEDRAN